MVVKGGESQSEGCEFDLIENILKAASQSSCRFSGQSYKGSTIIIYGSRVVKCVFSSQVQL